MCVFNLSLVHAHPKPYKRFLSENGNKPFHNGVFLKALIIQIHWDQFSSPGQRFLILKTFPWKHFSMEKEYKMGVQNHRFLLFDKRLHSCLNPPPFQSARSLWQAHLVCDDREAISSTNIIAAGVGFVRKEKLWLKPGDDIRCEVGGGIGTLVNKVERAPAKSRL